jgi:hypothetical protein
MLNKKQEREKKMNLNWILALVLIAMGIWWWINRSPPFGYTADETLTTPKSPSFTGKVIRYSFDEVTWEKGLHLLAHPHDLDGQDRVNAFMDSVLQILRAAPFKHYLLETPMIQMKQPFEFYLVEVIPNVNKKADLADFPSVKESPSTSNIALVNQEHGILLLPVPLFSKSNCSTQDYVDLSSFVKCSDAQAQHLLQQMAVSTFQLYRQHNGHVWILSRPNIPWTNLFVTTRSTGALVPQE